MSQSIGKINFFQHSVDDIGGTLNNMAGWYARSEGGLLTRDIGTLFGGLKNQLEEPNAFRAITHRDNPVQDWVKVSNLGIFHGLIMKPFIRSSFTIFLTTVAILIVSCSARQQAMSKVHEGMTRAKAIEILSEDAWYYQECPEITTKDDHLLGEDLFFYGSHKYDDSQIVIVHSTKQESEWIVDQVSTFDSYAWHTAYSHCFQRDKFEN